MSKVKAYATFIMTIVLVKLMFVILAFNLEKLIIYQKILNNYLSNTCKK